MCCRKYSPTGGSHTFTVHWRLSMRIQQSPCQDVHSTQLHWHWQFPAQDEVSSWLPLTSISPWREWGSQKPVQDLWGGSESGKILSIPVLHQCGEVRWGHRDPEFSGHETIAELEIANTTFGIQQVHVQWTLKIGTETLQKTIRTPIQTTGFCQCQREESADEVTSPRNSALWLLPPALGHECIQWWSSAVYNVCHFVFGRAEVTKWRYFYLFHFIYLRPAFIKLGTEIPLDFPSVFFYCFCV